MLRALVIVFCLLISPISALAADDEYRVVGVQLGDRLKIRERPRANIDIMQLRILGSIAHNETKVQTTGRETSIRGQRWLEVKYQGVTGWVNGRYLSANLKSAEKIGLRPKEGANDRPSKWHEIGQTFKHISSKPLSTAREAIWNLGPWQKFRSMEVRADQSKLYNKIEKWSDITKWCEPQQPCICTTGDSNNLSGLKKFTREACKWLVFDKAFVRSYLANFQYGGIRAEIISDGAGRVASILLSVEPQREKLDLVEQVLHAFGLPVAIFIRSPKTSGLGWNTTPYPLGDVRECEAERNTVEHKIQNALADANAGRLGIQEYSVMWKDLQNEKARKGNECIKLSHERKAPKTLSDLSDFISREQNLSLYWSCSERSTTAAPLVQVQEHSVVSMIRPAMPANWDAPAIGAVFRFENLSRHISGLKSCGWWLDLSTSKTIFKYHNPVPFIEFQNSVEQKLHGGNNDWEAHKAAGPRAFMSTDSP